MNEKNIEAIKKQLVSLGLPADVEFELRANICLQQDHFFLHYRQAKEQDIINSIFYLEKKENEYCCSYYEACLRKKITVPDIVLNEISVGDLHERMSRVDWQSLLSSSKKNPEAEVIEEIINDLKTLSNSHEGSQLGERLKIKFWIDTPLIFLIPNVSALRNQFEVSQRFYFFDGEDQISLDEAYRFLSHRWREKQLNKKKPTPDPAVVAESDSPASTSKSKKSNKGKHK